MKMNVLRDFPYRPYHYLRHPLTFLRHCILNLKAAWRRATRGFCDMDVAECAERLLALIPLMLRQLARGDSYPATGEFPTLESWHKYLEDLASQFEAVQEDNWEAAHPNEWEDGLRRCGKMTASKDVRDNYFTREKQLFEERQAAITDAYTELTRHYPMLWD